MNKRQKEVIQYQENAEKKILKDLERQYRAALDDINMSIQIMMTDEQTQSKVYRIQYQKALRSRLEAVLKKLHATEFESINAYLQQSYVDSFVGTMYDHHGQGIPLIMPFDENAAVKAVVTDSQLSEDLYTSLGVDTQNLKKTIRQEITRGIASSMAYRDIARNISQVAKTPLNRAKTIVDTEAHRIQEAARYDAMKAAKAKGCDEVKIWTSLRNGNVRDAHRELDGQIREVDEPFEYGNKKAMYPGDFGVPELDIRCHCKGLTRAKWMLDETLLEEMKDKAAYFKLDKTDRFEEFREKYLYAADHPEEYLRKADMPADFKDTRKLGEPIKQDDLKKVIESARLKGVQIGTLDNPTGGFETYCGDVNVLYGIIDQAAKQMESKLFKNAREKNFVLMYDNIIGYENKQKVIDIGAFAMTQGKHITLNKFMFDDSAYLAKEYAEAVAAGLFPKGTDHMCIIAHETGHIIAKKTGGLYKKVLGIVQREAENNNMTMDEYIIQNVSMYGKELDSNWDYHELIPELNSMLNSGKKYGIIEVLKKEGVF